MKCSHCKKEFKPKTSWQKFCSANCRWKIWDRKHPRKKIAMAILAFLIMSGTAQANELPYPVDAIVSAIYAAEGGAKAAKPFGILSVPCSGYEECRRICKNTVVNNWKRFNDYGYKTHPDYLSFLADRYCPVSVDPVGNKNWKKNVRYFLGVV